MRCVFEASSHTRKLKCLELTGGEHFHVLNRPDVHVDGRARKTAPPDSRPGSLQSWHCARPPSWSVMFASRVQRCVKRSYLTRGDIAVPLCPGVIPRRHL